MLSVRALHAYYGKSHILQGANLEVGGGEIVSLADRKGIGPPATPELPHCQGVALAGVGGQGADRGHQANAPSTGAPR